MKNSMKIVPSLLLISGLFTAGSVQAQMTSEAPEPVEPIMCTMDVKQCPDGSFVGRSGPTCEFVCPVNEEGPSTDVPRAAEPGTGDRDRLRDSDFADSVDAPRAEFTENQEARQELRTERRIALSEVRQERIINLAANISNRMDAAVLRLFTIIDRLESRLQKLDQQGVDITTARASLQEATQSLAEARAALVDIDADVYNATTGEEAYTAWQDLRAHYQSIASSIRSTHTSLRAVIAALKVSLSDTTAQSNMQGSSQEEESVTETEVLPTL
jgi:hypothetical protein